MTISDLKSANDEILRLKLLLGMKIDGGFEEEDKLRLGMLKRMKILDEMEEMKALKDEIEEAYEKYEIHFNIHEKVVKAHNKKCEELDELRVSIEKDKEELEENIHLIIKNIKLRKIISRTISEATVKTENLKAKIDSESGRLREKNRVIINKKKNILHYKECSELSKKEHKDLESRYKELKYKLNSGKSKDMESLSGDFEVKVDISGKRILWL